MLAAVLALLVSAGQARQPFGPGDLVYPLIWFDDVPAGRDTSQLPADARRQFERYRARERAYTPSADLQQELAQASNEAAAMKTIGAEHVVFALFDRPDARRLAHDFAAEMAFPGECEGDEDCVLGVAYSADEYITHHPRSPVLPYAHLLAGFYRACAIDYAKANPNSSESRALIRDAHRHLRLARNGGNPLIRVLGDYLLARPAPACE